MNKNCTTCKNAVWSQTKSGRRDLNRGVCNKTVIFPVCYVDHWGDFPIKRAISKYTGKLSAEKTVICECWENLND